MRRPRKELRKIYKMAGIRQWSREKMDNIKLPTVPIIFRMFKEILILMKKRRREYKINK